ncbi:MFS transporter [Neobacillus mesonae]|nr:MFS transporter [Neobacillus mesonae]
MKWLDHYPKEVKVFLIASLVNATGSSLMWPLTTMYVFDELGRSMSQAGFVILIQSLGGIFGQLIGGGLYHKIGVKKLIVGSLILNAIGLFTLPWISGIWWLFVVMMGLIGLFNSLSLPAIQAFVGFRFADRRGELFNVIYVAQNIGVALGTALSGFLADISYHLSFIMNGVTSAIFGVYFFVYLSKVDREQGTVYVPKKHKSEEQSQENTWYLMRNIRLYLFISLGTLFILIGNSIWNTGVSPFIIEEGMEKKAYSLLWTLNGILIFVAQPVTTLIKKLIAPTSSTQMIVSSVLYTAGFAVIALFQHYPGMILAMILITLGEMLISPATPAFISEHGGKAAPFYLGVSGGIGAIGRVAGPYAMGIMYDGGGLSPVAWFATITAGISIIAFIVHAKANASRGHALHDESVNM